MLDVQKCTFLDPNLKASHELLSEKFQNSERVKLGVFPLFVLKISNKKMDAFFFM